MSPFAKKAMLVVALLAGIVILGKLSSSTSSTSTSSCGCGGSTCAPSATAPDIGNASPEAQESVAASKGKGLPKLVELGSTTCMPCKMMAPIIDELSAKYKGKLDVEFIDVSENREAASKYKVRAIPTQVFLDENGKEFFRHQGFFAKEDILAKLKEHGVDLGKDN